MTHKFSIDNTELVVSTEKLDSFTVKSHPKNYEVVFSAFTNSFSENDVVLVDKNI